MSLLNGFVRNTSKKCNRKCRLKLGRSGEAVTIGIGRYLFQIAALLKAAAAAIAAPLTSNCEHVFVDRLNSTCFRSLAAAWLPYRAAYIVCFSPAFIFANLPRGPPIPPEGLILK